MLCTMGVSISRHTHIRVLLLLVNMRTTTHEYNTAKRGSSFMSGLPRDPDVKFQNPPLILTKTKTKDKICFQLKNVSEIKKLLLTKG